MGIFSFFSKDKKETLDKGLSKTKESVGIVEVDGAHKLVDLLAGGKLLLDLVSRYLNIEVLRFLDLHIERSFLGGLCKSGRRSSLGLCRGLHLRAGCKL